MKIPIVPGTATYVSKYKGVVTDTIFVRSQSPKAEDYMRDKVSDAIGDLLSSGFLYQNRTIDLGPIRRFADNTYSADMLEQEFMMRPWVPFSLNRGFTHGEKLAMNLPTGVPANNGPLELPITIVLPTVETWCSVCKDHVLHDSIPYIEHSPYHLNREAVAEPKGIRTYNFDYQCHKCKGAPIRFLVRREFNKVQLCGRNRPYFPKTPKSMPKNFEGIFRDALQAAACNDIPAGFYHLRTFLEHHMKCVCGIPLETQIEGTELCKVYHTKIDSVVAQRSGLTDCFTECSRRLHERTGGVTEFSAVAGKIEKHFDLIQSLKAIGT
jgi:hypothetical protein